MTDPWAQFVYQGPSAYAGQAATPEQRAYATANQSFRDQSQPIGSPQNPSYDTPDATGSADIAHVNQKGQLVAPDAWSAFLGEPKMGAAEDAARTAPGALARGVTGLLGLPGDLDNLGQKGFNWLANHAASAVQDITGNDLGLPHHPNVHSEPRGITTGDAPTSGDLNAAVQQAAGAYHIPQTMAGRAVDTVGQMAPVALMPGSAPAKIARVLIPSGTSEAAGEFARDPRNPGGKSETLARLLGAVGGGGVQGAFENVARAPQIAASTYLHGYTPQDISGATSFMADQLARHGLSVTPLEALTQTAGGAANQLQHYVENSHLGKPMTQAFFDQRPGQVKGAVNWAADLISPDQTPPGMLAVQAQRSAENAIGTARRAVNAEARPFYEALPAQQMPAEAYSQVVANPSYARALADFRSQPELNAPYAHLPDNNMAVINEVQKQLDTNAASARPGEMNPNGNHQLEAARVQAGTLADMLARDASPEYAAAHDTVSAGRAAQVAPLQAGPLGEIAAQRTPNLSAQTAALYPSRPNVGGVGELVSALERMPDVGAPLTRQHVLDTADNALRDLQPGENQWGGAALAKALASSDEQAARLHAGVHTTAGPEVADHMASLLEGLRATGKRMQPGSGTQFNAERAAAMGISPSPVRTLSTILDPLEIGRHIDKAVGGAMYRRNIGSLADFLTNMSPEDAQGYLERAMAARGRDAPVGVGQLLLTANGGRQ